MSIVELTQDNFSDIVTAHEIIFVDFWAKWCEPCKAFAQTFEEAAKENKSILFAKVDVDKERELAESFHIMSIPHLLVLKKKVAIYSESVAMPLSALNELAQQALAAEVMDEE